MIWLILIVVVVCVSGYLLGNRGQSLTEYKGYLVGGLYSTKHGRGLYKVVKILAVDSFSAHIRMYNGTYGSRPSSIEPSTLSFGFTADDLGNPEALRRKLAENIGMGHVPISWSGFIESEPVLIVRVSVSEDELEGYRLYKKRIH